MGSAIIVVGMLWLARWYVQVRQADSRAVAASCGAAVAALHLLRGAAVLDAAVTGAIVGIVVLLLFVVDARFHSVVTIPLWLIATLALLVLLVAVV